MGLFEKIVGEEVTEQMNAAEQMREKGIIPPEERIEKEQEVILKGHKKPLFGDFGILLGFLPFIIIAIIIWMIANIKPDDYKNDCVIGRDSPDCLEGSGSGHSLWNN